MVSPGQSLPNNIPFVIGQDLIVDIPINPRGMVNLYLHWPNSQHQRHKQCKETQQSSSPWSQCGNSGSLQIQTPSLNDMDAWAKLIAETGLSEQKIILGCIQDFRQMTIMLPENKFVAYPKSNIGNAPTRIDFKRRIGDEHQKMGLSWTNSSHGSPYPQQLTFTKATCREKDNWRL